MNAIAKEDSSIASSSLESLIKTRNGKVFNLAAQVWNHTFYWNSMSPNGGGQPSGRLMDLIKRDFGSYDQFKEKFSNEVLAHFGSGWVWIVLVCFLYLFFSFGILSYYFVDKIRKIRSS